MLNKLKSLFQKSVSIPEIVPDVVVESPKEKKPRKPRKPKEITVPVKTEKELATEMGEPYISILKIDIDPNNINAGSFELDWNSKFAANLARAGYQMKPGESEDVIVDRWFKEICRNIVLEMYEQDQADPENREVDMLKEELRHIRSKDIGNGRTEIS
jgi:hypothetical protein